MENGLVQNRQQAIIYKQNKERSWPEKQRQAISTHWDRDKMAAVSQTTLSSAFLLKENVTISIKISLKFVP